MKALHDHYGIVAIADWDCAGESKTIDLGAALDEQRVTFKRLLWYWLVNFDKIIGSLVKFQENICASNADLAMMTKSTKDLRQVTHCIERLQSE